MNIPTGYTALPTIHEEVVDASQSDLAQLGLAGIDGLGGIKIFKKIGHAFKKVGKAISKVKISKIVKIALPIVGGVILGPLAGGAIAKVASKIGGKTAALVKGGAKDVQRVVNSAGKEVLVLLTPAQRAALKKVIPDPNKAITEAALRKLLGPDVLGQIIPGAEFRDGMLHVPITSGAKIEQEKTIPLKAAGIGTGVAVAIAAGIALAAGKRGRR